MWIDNNFHDSNDLDTTRLKPIYALKRLHRKHPLKCRNLTFHFWMVFFSNFSSISFMFVIVPLHSCKIHNKSEYCSASLFSYRFICADGYGFISTCLWFWHMSGEIWTNLGTNMVSIYSSKKQKYACQCVGLEWM